MQEPITIAEVPTRILQRYAENLQYLIQVVSEFIAGFQQEETTNIRTQQDSEIFGFDKTLVLLTKPNKVLAISSLTGQIIWSQRISSPVARLFVQQNTEEGTVDIKVVTQAGQVIQLNPLTGQTESQTPLPRLAQGMDQTEFVLMQGVNKHTERPQSTIIAMPSKGEGEVVQCLEGVKIQGNRPLFISQVDRENGRLSGYRLSTDKMVTE